ncbi:MAG: transporter substrate-binding domain-containing protein [Treponema sp.]|jgi:polar amino acid transport system substrate-binding protein|nr:transporter substrate-binding domain-containing protein [Treponema sp.]
MNITIRKKISLALSILIFFTNISFIGCTKRKQHGLTIKEGILTAGVEIGYPPMEYYDTDGVTLTGFDIELTKVLADRLGLQVKYIDTAWDGILAGLDTYRYDIVINVTILPERKEKYNFTKPYIDSSIIIVTLKDSFIKIEKPEDIENYSIGFQSDTTAQYFTERLSNQDIHFRPFSYDKILNCFDDLKLGRLDLIAVDNLAAFDYTRKTNSPFKEVWQGYTDEYISICLKKGNEPLTIALNNALDELFADGTLLDISQKYFNHDLISSVRNDFK